MCYWCRPLLGLDHLFLKISDEQGLPHLRPHLNFPVKGEFPHTTGNSQRNEWRSSLPSDFPRGQREQSKRKLFQAIFLLQVVVMSVLIPKEEPLEKCMHENDFSTQLLESLLHLLPTTAMIEVFIRAKNRLSLQGFSGNQHICKPSHYCSRTVHPNSKLRTQA